MDPDICKHYLVKWTIDVWASTPEEAALKALNIQRNVHSTATVFECIDRDADMSRTVDLSAIGGVRANTVPPDPVHIDNGRWYFWDESWAHRCGPYQDESIARQALAQYQKFLEGK